KLGEARQWTQSALKLNPSNIQALYELGSIDARTDPAAGIAEYEKGLAVQENYAPLQRELGMLYFQQQDYANAAKQLARAAELGMNGARSFNFLCMCSNRIRPLALA